MKNISRRKALKNSAIVLSAVGIQSCVSPAGSEKSVGGKFVHSVYFWMNNPSNEAEMSLFKTNTLNFLAGIDVIKTYQLGAPAMTPREVVDNSYTFNLVVTFDSPEDQDIYQVHPIHKEFVEDTQHLWNKVLIYDAISVM
jgi:hypothetical protein